MDSFAPSVVDEVDLLIDSGISALNASSAADVREAPKARRPSHDSRKSARQGQSIMSFFGATESGTKVACGTSQRAAPPPRAGSCYNCGSEDVVMHAVDSMRCCRDCDAVEYVVIDNERPAKRDVPRDSTSFSFKRLSHFNEWLSQIQGKDHPSIPENVIGFVMVELRRNYINNAAEVKTSQVRAILKKLKLSRYYEHVPYIIARIRGVPSERMSPQMEDNLRTMFRKIQIPFINNSPPERKNFLSYGYVLHKFVQLLGHTEYLEKFPLLKSRDKLRVQDDIWRKICAELHWEFVPSV